MATNLTDALGLPPVNIDPESQRQTRLKTQPTNSGLETGLARFLVSAGWSAGPGLFNIQPPAEVMAFRRDNPWTGFGSELTGLLVPYGAWAGATRLPRIASRVDKIGDMAQAPIRTAVKQELVRWLPFEAGRVLGSAALGGDTIDTLAEAAIDLGLFGGVAGLGALVRSAGPKTASLLRAAVGEDLRAPIQVQLRQINEAVRSGRVQLSDDLQRRVEIMSRVVREETPGRGTPFVRGLELGGDPQRLNRMWRIRKAEARDISKRRFFTSAAASDFKSKAEWQVAARRMGMPEAWEQFVQFPRYVRAKTEKGKRILAETTKGMEDLGDGWFLTKEQDPGLYVMARRLGDEFAVFKTDTPGIFVPHRKKWADIVTNRAAWYGHEPRKTPGATLFNSLIDMMEQVPAINYLDDLARNGKPREIAQRTLDALGIDRRGLGTDTLQRVTQFVDRFLTPTQLQNIRAPRARWIQAQLRYGFERADAQRQKILFGTPQNKTTSNLFQEIFISTELEGGIVHQIRALDETDMNHLWQIWRGQIPLANVAKMGVSDRLLKLVTDLDTYDKAITSEIIATQKAAGAKKIFNPLPEHYQISRTWKGGHRAFVYNEEGRLVYIGSGYTAKQAAEEAKGVIDQAADVGRDWRGSGPQGEVRSTLSGRDEDIVGMSSKLAIRHPDYDLALRFRDRFVGRPAVPGFQTPRKQVRGEPIGGYVGGKQPWTKKELEDIISAHVTQQQKYVADLSTRTLLQREMLNLRREDPQAWASLASRFDDFAGRQGPVAAAINRQVDKVFGGLLGKNSASKIVAAANSTMFHLTLGMGQIAFPLLNAMTFLHTVLPQTAFVLSAPQRARWAYSWLPSAGADGLPKAPIGYAEPLKLAWRSIMEMKNPSPELKKAFERAGTAGVWDPRFVEEYVGQSSRIGETFKRVLSGDEGFLRLIENASQIMPAASEKFARGHAFTNGYIIGRDFMGIADEEQLYRFAKEFTENTMFLYSTADRARAITGPFGSAFGLFKNWQMHYISWMLEFAGEGALRGNWLPLLWMTGGTGAAAGVGGLPLYGAADAFSRWASDESLMEHIYDWFGPGNGKGEFVGSFSDAVFMGLPAFFGISLQGSAAAPFADPARDASMLMSLVYWDRMKALGEAAGNAFDAYYATGRHPADSASVRDSLVRAFAPKTMYRAMSSLEGDYIRSMSTGNPRITDLSLAHRLMYVTGLNPVQVERYNQVASELWMEKEKMRAAVQNYGQAYTDAYFAGNWRETNDIILRAMAEGVDISSVMRSANARISRRQQDVMESQFEPQDIQRYMKVLGR